MPIYEYKCESCGQVSELIMKFSDPQPEKCAHCGSGPLTKLMSATSFHLKGGGWYSDGYDSKSNKSSEPSKSKEAPKTSESPAKTKSEPAKD